MKHPSQARPDGGSVMLPCQTPYPAIHCAGGAEVVVVPRGAEPSAEVWSALVSGLPPLERQRLGRTYRNPAQHDSALGWQLLQDLAGRHGVSVWRGSSGRPVSNPPVDLSMSHGGGWVAAAASRQGRVGVDVEAPRDVSAALARRCLSSPELAWLDRASGAGERQDRFVQLWTAKEAYLKAIGTGLGLDPRAVTIDCSATTPRLSGADGSRWLFHSSTVTGGVRVTSCAEQTS